MRRRILQAAGLVVLFAAGFSIGVNLGHEHVDDCPRCRQGAGALPPEAVCRKCGTRSCLEDKATSW